MLKFSEIPQITQGELLNLHEDQVIENLLIDSRQRSISAGTLFFAIRGPRHNGHLYIPLLYQRGIRYFVIEATHHLNLEEFPAASFISVDHSVTALQAVATQHRQNLSQIPVLGITGSNAKTIIKEWLYQLLDDRKVIKSPKSYNSQVGVPLSVWQLNPHADLGIFEAGISQRGEMQHLEPIIKPQFGIFTNIGTAHDAGFDHAQQKAQEKSILFKNCRQVIYCRDHELVHQVLTAEMPEDRLISWSWNQQATMQFELVEETAGYTVAWEYGDTKGAFSTPFQDLASLENLCHCATFMITNGYSETHIASRILELQSVEHRLALKKGAHGCYLIDDTYNNDLAGLEIALDFLNQQPHSNHTSVILSDVQQAAESPDQLYQKIAKLLEVKKIGHFYGIGPQLCAHKSLFAPTSVFYASTEEFLAALPSFHNHTMLIKGAREFRFERIVESLEEKIHGTVLEINLDALTSNLNRFRSLIPATTKIMVMVKAFAYGSGSDEIAHMLQYQGVDYLGVAYADEGIALRRDGIELPIMVMNPSEEGFGKLVQYQLEPELYNLSIFKKWVDYPGTGATPVHLKLDTGMHRLGFEEQHLPELIALLKEHRIPVASIFSHLAVSDEMDQAAFTHQQAQSYQSMAERLQAALPKPALKHLLNSSGIQNFQQYHFDMVRLGIGLYGVGTSGLQTISTLKSTISQIKQLKAGDTVGYGRLGVVEAPTTVATIAIGYADGFDRRHGNGVGSVKIKNQMAPVIGNVCMDMTMVDISAIPEAAVGDVVTIFDDQHTIEDLAKTIGTIPYEILTHISSRVKRVYYAQ